jgi:cysteine-rich repeat protein
VCSVNTYDLYRYRACSVSCTWPTWSPPVGGDQQCGNGTTEGDEFCDDGNTSNNDVCLNTCEWNVCGDDYVYIGVESCDDGDQNGEACTAPYGGSCNFCNATCQYQTASGGYCGDGLVNGGEVCEGTYSTRLRYFDSGTHDTLGTCSYIPPAPVPTAEDLDENDYTCRWLGVCNGGIENGELCTLDYEAYLDDGVIQDLESGNDRNTCAGWSAVGDEGVCVPPACADNCGSSCPTSFSTIGLQIQAAAPGSLPADAINLYSFGNDENDAPDVGNIFVPACTAATQLIADIDNQNVVLPDVDVVFVTDLSGSMDTEVYGGDDRRIEVVVESTQEAVSTLFDAYADFASSTLRIGLVSFHQSSATLDEPLIDLSGESALLSALDDSRFGWGRGWFRRGRFGLEKR